MTWGTWVKLCWGVPRACRSYIVENLLAVGFKSFSTQIKTRYVNFFQRLLVSKSDEVCLLAELTRRDASSTTGRNLSNIRLETGLDPWNASSYQISDKLSSMVTMVPPQDSWRLPYFENYCNRRKKWKPSPWIQQRLIS